MPDTDTIIMPTGAGSRADVGTTFAVEQFLYDEAELLDQWRLHEWLDLFAPEGHYMIPTTNLPDGDPAKDLFLVHDDRFLLEQRVNSLQTRAAHAEYPHSQTRRSVTNVRVIEQDDKTLAVTATFVVHRIRAQTVVAYVGQYRHVLLRDAGRLRFLVRKAVLDLDALRPHGKVSIIL